MALTFREAQLVKSTIPFLREQGEELSNLVYGNLVKRNPELNNKLNVIHLQDGRLARALTVVILRFACNINDMSELIPKLERVCNKHCTMGVQPAHYELLGTLVIEAFETLMGDALTPEIRAAWTKAYSVLSHMLIGRERIIYRDFERDSWPAWRRFKVDRKVFEADGLWSFHLIPCDEEKLPKFFPGQYVTIRLFVPEIGYYQTRQYSISDSVKSSEEYRITVKRAVAPPTSGHDPGMVSHILLDRIRTSEELDVSHPSGEFYYDTTVQSSMPVVLISAGSGVAPLMAILNTITEEQQQRQLSWIHGCRYDVPFATRLKVLKRRCQNLRTCVFKTVMQRGDVVPGGGGGVFDHNCRVDLYKVEPEMLFVEHLSAEYYICGPEEFMKTMMQQLIDMGVDNQRIKTELFGVGKMKLDSVCVSMTQGDSDSFCSR